MDGVMKLAWAVGIGVVTWAGAAAIGATPNIIFEHETEAASSSGVEVGEAVSIEDEGIDEVASPGAEAGPGVEQGVAEIEAPPVEADADALTVGPAVEAVAVSEAESGDAASAGLAGAAIGEEAVSEPESVEAIASNAPMPLPVRETLPLGAGEGASGGDGGFGAMATNGLGIARTVGAVGGVLILILLVRMLLGRAARLGAGGIRGQLGAGGRAPSGIVQILGRYPVSRGQMLVLMKLDRRVLLLSQTSAGFATLSEITDADDVASILSKSRDEEGESLTARFGAMLRRLERDPEMGRADDVEIAPYLRRPSLDEIEGFDGDEGLGGRGGAGSDRISLGHSDDTLETDDAGDALRRRLEGLRGLSA